MMRKVIEPRQLARGRGRMAGVRGARVLEASVGIPQLVEERMGHGLDGGQALGRSVFQQGSDQIDRFVRSFAENLCILLLALPHVEGRRGA